MGALQLKYDSSYDSWILELIRISESKSCNPFPHHRHSSAETVSSSSSSRNSHSSGVPLRSFFQSQSSSPPHLPSLARFNHGRIWKSLKRHWTCFKQPSDGIPPKHVEKATMECRYAFAKPSSLASEMHSDTCYSAMNDEERDENLKAAVFYCKKSLDTDLKH